MTYSIDEIKSKSEPIAKEYNLLNLRFLDLMLRVLLQTIVTLI